MSSHYELLKKRVLTGGTLEMAEAEYLTTVPLEELTAGAREIREKFCQNKFDICSIINAKSGHCSEDCKYCAQSAHYCTTIKHYDLASEKTIMEEAKRNAEAGMLRFSLVTSGKRLPLEEVEALARIAEKIEATLPIKVCVSFGLLSEEGYRILYKHGIRRIHNNLETSEHYFPSVCTTHTFAEKIAAIRAAQRVGMEVCSGGIMGLGESMHDRIEMAFTLRELGIKSVPLNILNPIENTPYANNMPLSEQEICRIIAIYRFILPDAFLRLAGGRGLLMDKGEACFQAGANAAISGDMLTTAGITAATDLAMLKRLNFKVGRFS